jgi:hypothetical protein
VRFQPKPTPDDSNCPPAWRAKQPLTLSGICRKFVDWLREQTVLFEAFWVAVTFHVLLFPLIWFIGWALPWPKSPSITTVIEINLSNWPNDARPERIEELYNYELKKARDKSH